MWNGVGEHQGEPGRVVRVGGDWIRLSIQNLNHLPPKNILVKPPGILTLYEPSQILDQSSQNPDLREIVDVRRF